jgi:hypothetical protein
LFSMVKIFSSRQRQQPPIPVKVRILFSLYIKCLNI